MFLQINRQRIWSMSLGKCVEKDDRIENVSKCDLNNKIFQYFHTFLSLNFFTIAVKEENERRNSMGKLDWLGRLKIVYPINLSFSQYCLSMFINKHSSGYLADLTSHSAFESIINRIAFLVSKSRISRLDSIRFLQLKHQFQPRVVHNDVTWSQWTCDEFHFHKSFFNCIRVMA